jgi:transposase
LDKKMFKADIALTFNVKLTSVYAILSVFEKEGRVQKKLKGGPRRKLIGKDHKVFIKKAINDDCGIIRSLKQMLLSKFNINVSLSTISRYIEAFNLF